MIREPVPLAISDWVRLFALLTTEEASIPYGEEYDMVKESKLPLGESQVCVRAGRATLLRKSIGHTTMAIYL